MFNVNSLCIMTLVIYEFHVCEVHPTGYIYIFIKPKYLWCSAKEKTWPCRSNTFTCGVPTL